MHTQKFSYTRVSSANVINLKFIVIYVLKNIFTCFQDYSSNVTTSADNSIMKGHLTRIETMVRIEIMAIQSTSLIGREKEKWDLFNLISDPNKQGLQVISVWGMGGVGKTTLVKDVCQSQGLINMFHKHAYVTVTRPFNLMELLRSLIMQLKKGIYFEVASRQLAIMGSHELREELQMLVGGTSSLIVLDDLSSTAEWDMLMSIVRIIQNNIRIIITTRDKYIARYCSRKEENVYRLGGLQDSDALGLFTLKIWGSGTVHTWNVLE